MHWLSSGESLTTQQQISTWCHRKQSLLIIFTIQTYKFYFALNCHFIYPKQGIVQMATSDIEHVIPKEEDNVT